MTYIEVCRSIQDLAPEASLLTIQQRVKNRYKQILRKRDWSFLNDHVNVATAAEYDTGTISIDVGGVAVTGVGTTFTSGMVNRMLYVGTSNAQGYMISAFTDTTHITISDPYASATAASGSSFSIKAIRFSPSVADIAKIVRITYDTRPIIEKPFGYFDRIDPDRSDTGEPIFYSVVKKSAQSGTVLFEIYPVPDGEYIFRVDYVKKVSDLSDDADELLIDLDLIEPIVLHDCYARLASKNPAYIGMARDKYAEYIRNVEEASIIDMEQMSLPETIKDVMSEEQIFLSDEFSLDHDTGEL